MTRPSTLSWILRTPLVNGGVNDYTEWLIKDIGPTLVGTTRCFVIGGISTYENSIRRVQSDYTIAGAVFEDAQNYGLVADPLGALWDYCENGHGHITDTALTIKMDGGSDLANMLIGGGPVLGSSLVINQGFNIRLPKNDSGPPPGFGTVIGSVSSQHTLDLNGCLVARANTITGVGVGNINSYKAMLPVTGCNWMQFGSNAAIDVTPVNSGQGASQGHQTTVEAWHTDRPDLRLKMVCNAPNYADVTTSDTFVINNVGFSKGYINQNSGAAAIAAVNFANTTQYSAHRT